MKKNIYTTPVVGIVKLDTTGIPFQPESLVRTLVRLNLNFIHNASVGRSTERSSGPPHISVSRHFAKQETSTMLSLGVEGRPFLQVIVQLHAFHTLKANTGGLGRAETDNDTIGHRDD